MHSLLATALSQEAMNLDESEAKELASAIATVAEYYPDAVVSGKTMAWMTLFGVLGTTYGPRLLLLRLMLAERRKTAAQPSPVVDQFGMPVS